MFYTNSHPSKAQNFPMLPHSPTLNSSIQFSPNFSPSLIEQHPNLEETKQIHTHFIKTCFISNDQIPFTALHSYSSPLSLYSFLVTSYIKNSSPKDAAKIYTHMRRNDLEVDNFLIPSVLKACCLISENLIGKEIHGYVVKNGLDMDTFVCNALIQMYSECESLKLSRQLFDKMVNRDVVSWSTMIRSYSQRGMADEAMSLLREMQDQGIKPSEAAMINMIDVYAECADSKLGKAMHAYVVRNQNYERSRVPLTTALIDMYAKCITITYARRLFDGLSDAGIVSWTTMIGGCIHCNDLNEGVRLFANMLKEGLFPNEITMLSFYKECGFIGSLGLGKWLHALTLRNGFKISLVLATGLIDMYGKCGDSRSARSVFDSISDKDLTMWSALISAYAQTNCIDQAFDTFVQMTSCGIRPNEVTMSNLLLLCAKAGALEMGKWVHAYIDKHKIKVDIILKTSLMDMYAKCGDINAAYQLFTNTTDRDTLMWNAMISGFAMHGQGKEALELLLEMEKLGVIPNETTFVGVLHACSHAGLVMEGKKLFQRMVHEYNLVPNVQHYGCMVDLLGRGGLLDEAKKLISSMPMRPNMVVLGSLLAACKVHKNIKIAEWAAKQFLSLEPDKCGYYVLMSNIYAVEKRWDDVASIRRGMKDVGISKEPGITSIEVNGSVHDFVMGDKSHPEAERIYEMVGEMREKLEEVGYTPYTSSVLQNILDVEEKETALNYHSEKLAMAFGLISTAQGVPIRIVKNLRICNDCHTVTKLLSKIYGRVIVVRDRIRFHHFKDGYCSCMDYW